jgi:hypothetical protein
MFTFGTTVIEDKAYTSNDAKQIIAIEKFDIEDGFYGGRIKYIGKTDSDILLLMTDANTVIDTGAKDLEEISLDLIRELCKKRKIKFDQRYGKDKLIELLM